MNQMFNWLIEKIVLRILKLPLKGESRIKVVNALLDNLRVLPIRDIIKFNEMGQLLVRGKPLEHEQALQLKESARNVLLSPARRIVLDQVAYEAIKLGVYQATSPETILFAKAALWHDEQTEKILRLLAQEEETP